MCPCFIQCSSKHVGICTTYLFLQFSIQGPYSWAICTNRFNCCSKKSLFTGYQEDWISRFCPCCLELPRHFQVSHWHHACEAYVAPEIHEVSCLIFFFVCTFHACWLFFEFSFVWIEKKLSFQGCFTMLWRNAVTSFKRSTIMAKSSAQPAFVTLIVGWPSTSVFSQRETKILIFILGIL